MADSIAPLDTKLDPAFGIAGATLVLTGLALALVGSAYKRVSIFIATAYALAIAVLALILHFGVEQQVNAPKTGVRVGFFFASAAAGSAVGALAVVFHRGTKSLVPPVAGFLLGLTIQCLRNDGLIRPLGLRYFLFLGTTGILFIGGIIPRFQDAVFLFSTAFIGSLAFALGIDCFTAANLKEFYVFNLGFSALWPRMIGHFGITSAMQIELGVLLLVLAIGLAVQIRFFNVFSTRLARLLAKKESRAAREDEEKAAASRISQTMEKDRVKFEHRYSRGFPFAVPLTAQTSASTSLDSSSSPMFTTPSLSTPSSESAPLLPELNYVSQANKARQRQQSSLSIDVSRKLLTDDGSPTNSSPKELLAKPEPALTSPARDSKIVIEQHLKERETALEQIARLKADIGRIKTSLTPDASQRPTLITRPVSQYSLSGLIDTTPELLTDHTQTGSSSRPISTLAFRSKMVYSSTARPGVERVITGSFPHSHSQSMDSGLPPSVSPRKQIMDINELDARHRRRLSEIQGSAKAAAGFEVKRKSPPTYAQRLPSQAGPERTERVRSQTMDNLSTALNGAERPEKRDSLTRVADGGSRRLSHVRALSEQRGYIRRSTTDPAIVSQAGRQFQKPGYWLAY